ncbi:MAG: histidine kinase dimerization/phosphoacceptor domain -containing protein [Candidatus Eremiobacterota bacterium]
MKVQTKIIFLIVFLVILFLVIITLLKDSRSYRLFLLIEEAQKEKTATFDKVLELKSRSLHMAVSDYTLWDDMVNFIKYPSHKWAIENMDNFLYMYNADLLWVYRPDSSLVYSVNVMKDNSFKEIPLPDGFLSSLFDKKRFCHFFLNSSAGLIEIYGASVHPIKDRERKTQSQGYFFAGFIWNENYIKDLSLITDSVIKITPVNEKGIFISNPEKGTIIFSKILSAWNGKPVASINVCSDSSILKNFITISNWNFLLFIVFLVFLIMFLSVFLTIWINIPLNRIARALNTGNSEYLLILEKDKGEFGYISRLIGQFFKQKEDLAKEISDRILIEQQVRDLNAELEERVMERTIELAVSNNKLKEEAQERERAEEQILLSLKEKEVLIKEIHHRVKNNLQIISSLLYLQSDSIKDEYDRIVFKDTQSRIKSIALVHEKLYGTGDFSKIDFHTYLQSLLVYLRNTYKVKDFIKVNTDVAHIYLAVDKAIPCGLIVNELITNSLKYAFPDDRKGEIYIRLYTNGDKKVILEIEDDGIGLPEDFDINNISTLGLDLVVNLTRQIDGYIDIQSFKGTKININFTL